MQTSKECVINAIERKSPDRIPVCLTFDSDELNTAITEDILREYDPDIMIISGRDPMFIPISEGYTEWGYKMTTFGETMGEVKDPPLKSWDKFENWKKHLPDFTAQRRYEEARKLREKHTDKFLVGGLGMMMQEIINLRSYADCMMDYYEEEDNLNRLIDCLYDAGKQMADGYANAGMDAVIAWEDWGLQNGPMISYKMWEKYYFDRMKNFIDYVHKKRMKYILHSCGHITYLMDTFVDFGVDVIQMDQQMNMGLELLSKWKGEICFFCPVDIQHSVQMPQAEMSNYIKNMIHALSTEKGGFMYKAYAQPAAIHMTEAQLRQEIELFQNFCG